MKYHKCTLLIFDPCSYHDLTATVIFASFIFKRINLLDCIDGIQQRSKSCDLICGRVWCMTYFNVYILCLHHVWITVCYIACWNIRWDNWQPLFTSSSWLTDWRMRHVVTAYIVVLHRLSPATIYVKVYSTYCHQNTYIVAGDNICRNILFTNFQPMRWRQASSYILSSHINGHKLSPARCSKPSSHTVLP